MEINKTTGLKLWDERIGKTVQKAVDFSGREMHRGLYGVTTSDKGWNIDHIMPKALGGTDEKDNLEIVNHITNSEKGDSITFTANDQKFQVQKDKENKKYVIVKIDNKSTSEDIDRLKIYKRDVLDSTDFAGRLINQNEFNTEHENSWTLGYYNNDKKNVYAAHKKTVEEQNGKTSFKANGYEFKLRKIDGKYLFINQTDILDATDYYNVFAVSDKYVNNDINIVKDVLTVVFESGYEEQWKSKALHIFEKIIQSYDIKYNVFVTSRYGEVKLHFLFDTPNKKDTCDIHEIAMYFNSMRYYFNNNGLGDFYTIFHWTIQRENTFLLNLYADIDDHFENLRPRDHHYINKNTIFIFSEVVKYLKECKYKNDSFGKTYDENWSERNYIYTKLKDDAERYVK